MSTLDYQYIAEVAEKAQSGDSDAFAELYAATYQKQFRFAYNYLKDEYLAQDALQEAYILVLKNITTLKDPKLFISWLNQISFRVCFKLYRKQERYSTELSEFQNGAGQYQAMQDQGPEEQTVKIDQQEFIIRQVMSLPFSESQAIILHYYHEMTLKDIAKLMEISVSSVKRYLASGRERLKKILVQ